MISVGVAQPDVTIVLDNEGMIVDATLANSVSGELVSGWLGRPWFETVGEVGSERVRRMIEDARITGLSAFGHVVQRFPSGRELPIEYAAARVAGRSGLVAIGKNMQAVVELQSQLIASQEAREQEYWKLREIESRYRLLLDTSSEAVLLVRADTLHIAEVNLAATHGLKIAPDRDLLAEVASSDHAKLRAMFGLVQIHGRAPGIIVHLGPARSAWMVRASLLTGEPGADFLLQLAPVHVPNADNGVGVGRILDLIDRLPDGFVVLDRGGIIRQANAAFLDLVQVNAVAEVVGERLSRWLFVPGSEESLLNIVRREGAVRLFPTMLQGELGTEVEIEVAATADLIARPEHYAVLIRDVTARAPRNSTSSPVTLLLSPRSEQFSNGSMLSAVRDTVAAVERRCIGEALDRAGGNRTAAAELLGLSRQCLYAKLSRYGLRATKPQND